MKSLYLRENLSFDQAKIVVESDDKDGKSLYMSGICIQGGIRNANQRVYPVSEIGKAVKTLNDQIQNGYSVLGEVDHPDDLKRFVEMGFRSAPIVETDNDVWSGFRLDKLKTLAAEESK